MDSNEFRAKAITELPIPGFSNGETLKITVKKPSMLGLASQGKLPNNLMSYASKIVSTGIKVDLKKTDLKEVSEIIELYCRACMVEPPFEDVEDILTDAQKFKVFDFGIGEVEKLSTFRTDQENGSNNNDGQTLPEKAE